MIRLVVAAAVLAICAFWVFYPGGVTEKTYQQFSKEW